MINRRNILILSSAALLSACVSSEPLLNTTAPNGYAVKTVSVDMSSVEGLAGGRAISKSPAQIKADITATVGAVLKSASSAAGRPVSAQIKVDSVALVTPGQAFLLGGVSTITGVLQVTDAKTGQVIVPATKVFGTAKGGWAPGGLLAVVTTKKPEDDYKALVLGFANDVKKRLFGVPKK